MSLINDALKKAKQAQANAPARESAPQLRSPETDHPVRTGPSLFLPAILVAVGLIGAALIWVAMNNKPAAKNANETVSQISPALGNSEPVATLKSEEPAAAPPAPALPVAVAPAPPVTAASPAVTESKPMPAAAPVTPPPKLNGIFYNPTKPTAIVNNKLVSLGSRVDESTVVAITQASVTLVGGGQTNVLSLSE